MTNEFYKTGHYEIDHSTFGGIIHLSDFSPYPNGKTASRIIADWGFDHHCRQISENSKKTIEFKRKPLSDD